MMPNGNHIKFDRNFLLILVLTGVAFWPLTLHIYSLKNDDLVYFLPFRYHISEAIQSGSFPWWNPYLYTGLPIHSDIQSGVWNPVVLIISLFTTYDMTVLQWEMLFYLFLAGIGMYKLIIGFNGSRNAALIIAIGYLCCGYMTDSGSILPWIINAAYLPFAFLYFYRLLKQPGFSNAIKFSLAMAFLFTAGYPSFFIFSIYIMATGFVFYVTRQKKTQYPPLRAFLYFLIASVIFLIICSPVIFSWLNFLDYYSRGSGLGIERSVTNSFAPFSSISFLLPSAAAKHTGLGTDINTRNASIGIFILLFFLTGLFQKPGRTKIFLLVVILFSFLFTLGPLTPIREWSYRFLPFMDTFRHPSTFRVFTTIGIMILAAPAFDQLLSGDIQWNKKIKWMVIAFMGLVLLLILIYLPNFQFPVIPPGNGKEFLDQLSTSDIIFIQGVIQLFFLVAFLFLLWKKLKKWIPILLIFNSILFCWMALPFTVISQVRVSTINQYVRSFPKGFPFPSTDHSIDPEIKGDTNKLNPYGYESFYEKNITIQEDLVTPTYANAYADYLNDTALRKKFQDQLFFYFEDKNGVITMRNIRIIDFSNNHFIFGIGPGPEGKFHIFQQFHEGWEAMFNKELIGIQRSNRAFMTVDLPAGKGNLYLRFHPHPSVIISLCVSVVSLLLILIYFIFHMVKRYRKP